MDNKFKKYIFSYLDKRHPIDDKIVYFKDSKPSRRISKIFDVHGTNVILEWYKSRIGNVYCLIYPTGTQYWYKNGELHKDGEPAVITADGVEEWYKDGKLHRENGPAIIHPNGTKKWFLNGQLHRLDGPAIRFTCGEKHWYQNGVRHREDGPAITSRNGRKEWFINGNRVSRKIIRK